MLRFCPFRASNGLNDITQGAASLCPGLCAGCPFRAFYDKYILKVFKIWCNCCLSSIYAIVTVVPPRMSRSFHGHCHTRSIVMERLCHPWWNKCDNTACHNCAKRDAPRQPRGIHQDTSSQPYYANIGCFGEL